MDQQPGDANGTGMVRVDHVTGPGLPELATGGFLGRTSHDGQVVVVEFGRKDDVEVVGVGGEHGGEARGSKKAGSFQHPVICGVTVQVGPALRDAQLLEPFQVAVDDDEVSSLFGQIPADHLTHLSAAAHDHVSGNFVDDLLHLSFLQGVADLFGDHPPADRSDQVSEGPGAAHQVNDHEDDATVGDRLAGGVRGFPAPHRGESDHRQVEALQDAPLGDQVKADRADKQQRSDQANDRKNAFHGSGCFAADSQ